MWHEGHLSGFVLEGPGLEGERQSTGRLVAHGQLHVAASRFRAGDGVVGGGDAGDFAEGDAEAVAVPVIGAQRGHPLGQLAAIDFAIGQAEDHRGDLALAVGAEASRTKAADGDVHPLLLVIVDSQGEGVVLGFEFGAVGE